MRHGRDNQGEHGQETGRAVGQTAVGIAQHFGRVTRSGDAYVEVTVPGQDRAGQMSGVALVCSQHVRDQQHRPDGQVREGELRHPGPSHDSGCLPRSTSTSGGVTVPTRSVGASSPCEDPFSSPTFGLPVDRLCSLRMRKGRFRRGHGEGVKRLPGPSVRPGKRVPARLANPTEATVKSLECFKERAGGHVDQVCHAIGQLSYRDAPGPAVWARGRCIALSPA